MRETDDSVRVAGSLPPLSESYRPDLVPGSITSEPVYAAMVKALGDHVDLFFVEHGDFIDDEYFRFLQFLDQILF